MDDSENQIKFLCSRLASKGSHFSDVEIDEIVQTLKDVSLKLIITNVPREVYHNILAQEVFEGVFKLYDAHAKFLYLPSFSRAQVFMTRPEAALCARLQCQGWKLPNAVLDQLSPDSVFSRDHGGINCFIDQLDADNDNEDSSDDRSMDEECTCDTLINDLEEKKPSDCSVPSDSVSVKRPPLDVEFTELSSMSSLHSEGSVKQPTRPPMVQSVSSFDGSRDQSNLSAERSIGTPECDNTSEASGDDVANSHTSRSLHSKPICKKHDSRKTGRRLKLLAPPKPPRQFLLSPPASPPVGWEPKPEAHPLINYDLLDALAALAPGEPFELHPVNPEHSHPSIVITPCEPYSSGPRPLIVQTKCPERKL